MSSMSATSNERISQFASIKGGLIVSCQVPDGTPIDRPDFIAAQAQTVLEAGAIGIRAQGVANVAAIAKLVNVPIIGLVKRYLTTTPIHITPISEDVLALENAGATIVAIDATGRLRPDGLSFADFLIEIRRTTKLAILADVDSLEAAIIAESLGCDAIATTLSGYTDKPASALPNIKLVEEIVNKVNIPVLAEGGFSRNEQMKAAFDAGAWSVCIGTAITNPFLLTRGFVEVLD